MDSQQRPLLAPALDTVAWLNTTTPISLQALRGKVVVIHAFQMLCPGCTLHGLPQAAAIDQLYSQQDVQVIGLHTVFEHHEVMTAAALSAFIHEYQVPFPVAIDRPSTSGSIPHSMGNYKMQGTPTLIILDKEGHIRLNHFGRISDMQVGNIIGSLLQEKSLSVNPTEKPASAQHITSNQCGDDGCLI